MTTAEARRHDLYNPLCQFIGADKADTLMAYLRSQEASELATRADIADLSTRIDTVEMNLASRIDKLELGVDRLESRMNDGFGAVNQRLDRLFLALGAGVIAMIATVFAQAIV